MEANLHPVLLLALVGGLLLGLSARRGRPASRRRRAAGVLIFPISSISLTCLARRKGIPLCGTCPVRPWCWVTHEVPAAEESEGGPGGTLGGAGEASVPAFDLEQATRFVQALGRLLGRLVALFSLPTVRQALGAIWTLLGAAVRRD